MIRTQGVLVIHTKRGYEEAVERARHYRRTLTALAPGTEVYEAAEGQADELERALRSYEDRLTRSLESA